ncbi:2-oxo-4-hydroxy-4-carboxy-5-ureidoimidazoline decarboxylase [Arthrobacter sp. Sa2CUA1]|uniref:2-oxo-4-hydroxy-4-carboxy-5-ureidoimidazoline decarboxylase n=1 Tax=Arthrobacter gallicola TaxID=2762225 RepID=A0ABR8UQ62_9MICC|nr:2-oxo-4-hydroxy-4-carboxy-5-ureidoimidazoline decarboxylase [Arthrobacter gallicola]MBD7994687.1 2-oxo-4-hydroxy-4-carboxy-5-ureidoimidazoline decarboxylase [Arthrobacter gallicola]
MALTSSPDFLSAFNAASIADANAALKPCVDIPRWTSEIVLARPFGTPAELISFAELAAPGWTEAEIDGALAHHPRIGERADGSSSEAQFSRREQSGVATSADVQAQLAAGNRAYEERFGRVFLIRAAGRSAEEVLAALSQRLDNTPEEELDVIAAQLREIAILRLEGLLNQ